MTLAQLIEQQRQAIVRLQLRRQIPTDTLTQLRDLCTEGNRNLTEAEAKQARDARDARMQIDAEIAAHQSRLEHFEAEQRDQEAIERLSRQVGTGGDPGAPLYTAQVREYRLGRATTSPRPAEGAGDNWARSLTLNGRPAVVERGQRFADHPLVADRAARQATADQSVAGHYGSLGNLCRAMTTSSGSAIVPTEWYGDIIDRARNHAAVLQAGAQIVPMDAGVVKIGRLTTDPVSAFRTEGSTITASDPAFDNVTLTARTMSCLVVGSLEWWQDSINAGEIVEEAIAKSFGLQLDLMALFGGITTGGETGPTAFNTTYPSGPNPTGVLQTLLTAGYNVLGNAANGTSQTAATPWNELLDLVFTPTYYNETPNGLIWSPVMARRYAGQYDTTYQPLRVPPAFDAIPKYLSNQIPSNFTQGSSTTNMSDVFVGDWTKLLIGQRLEFSIHTLDQRYAESGQVGVVANWRGDIALARPRAFAVYRYLKDV